MIKIMSLSLAAALALTAGSSLAQATQPAQTRVVPAQNPRAVGFETERWLWTQDNRAQAHISKARVERAERAAELINANRCGDAYALAQKAKDYALAARITIYCNPHG